MATSSTWWVWQKAARAAMPSLLLAKEPDAPSRPMRASREADEISTPQIMRVTVTCLVCAMGSHATVRSCVTWAAVPGLSDGEKSPQDEREPSARGGTGQPVPPLRQFRLSHCRLFRDTRMTIHKWWVLFGTAQAPPATKPCRRGPREA